MMRWSLPIGTVLGIRMRLHFTFFILLALFALGGWQESGWGGVTFYVGTMLVLFLCILLHEFGHSIAALRFGVHVESITLLPIGGVASMGSIPEDPWKEFVIAIAGPLVNLVIAALLFTRTHVWPAWGEIWRIDDKPEDFLSFVQIMNLRLLAFNLLPAFPMDGGRIFRAALASFLPYPNATLIAALLGRFIAANMIIAPYFPGIYHIQFSPILSLIGVLIFFGAGYENRWVRLRAQLRGRTVTEIMRPVAAVVGPRDPLSHVLAIIHRVPQFDFPVLDQGRIVGLLPRDTWMDAASIRLDDPEIHEFMDTHFLTIRPQTELVRLIHDRKHLKQDFFPIVEDGRLVGYVTRSDINEIFNPAPLPRPPPAPPAARNGITIDMG